MKQTRPRASRGKAWVASMLAIAAKPLLLRQDLIDKDEADMTIEMAPNESGTRSSLSNWFSFAGKA